MLVWRPVAAGLQSAYKGPTPLEAGCRMRLKERPKESGHGHGERGTCIE